MEHRLQRRRPVRVRVELMKHGQVVGTSCATDISGGGVGIEPPAMVELRKGEMVDVSFPRPVPPVVEQCLRTVVVHKDKELIGLMFVHNSSH